MPTIMEDIEYLSQEIGPRPSGTEEEQQAALYIADQIQKRTGFAATIEDFAALTHPGIVEAICFGATALFSLLAIISRIFVIPAFLVGVVCVLLYAFELMDRPLLSRFFERGVSQNVVARYTPGSKTDQRGRKVVLVANYDSAKVQSELSGVLFRAYPFLVKGSAVALVVLPVIWLIRGLFLLHATGGAVSVLTLLAVVGILFTLVPVAVFVMHKLATYNEAANNNAAGVAALVEVARLISEGSVPEEELEETDAAHVHGEEAAYAADVVVEGAQLEYAPGVVQSERERLAAAKAAVAALTGQPLRQYVNEDVVSYISTTDGGQRPDYGEYGYPEQPGQEDGELMDAPLDGEGVGAHVAAAPDAYTAPSVPAYEAATNEPSWFTAGRAKASKPTGVDDAPVRRSRYADALEVALASSQAHFDEAARVGGEGVGGPANVPPRTFAPEGTAPQIVAHDTIQEMFAASDELPADSVDAEEVSEGPVSVEVPVAEEPDVGRAPIEEEAHEPVEHETHFAAYAPADEEPAEFAVAPEAEDTREERAVDVEAEESVFEQAEQIEKTAAEYVDDDETEEAADSVEASLGATGQWAPDQEVVQTKPAIEALEIVEEEPMADQQELAIEWQEELPSVTPADITADVVETRPAQPEPLVSVMMTDEEMAMLNGATTEMKPIDVTALREAGAGAAEAEPQELPAGDEAYDFSQIAASPNRRTRDIPLPSIGNTGKLAPLGQVGAAEEAPVVRQDPEREARERRAALRSVIPSLSGEFTPLDAAAVADEENSEVSKTGSFAAVGSAAAFEPVGDELVADLDPEDRYVDDADDSTFDENVTETGALTGPDYVDMPESRLSRFFSRFRKKNEEEQSTAEWLDVDENFNPTEVGAARGGWESFRNDDVVDDVADDGANAGIDEGSVSEDGRIWHGGAFSSRRAKKEELDEDVQEVQEEVLDDDSEAAVEAYDGADYAEADAAGVADDAEDDAENRADEADENEQIAAETALIHNFRNPDVNTEVWFVALGSEYAGNGGMKAFLDEHAEELRGAIIINMEALGAGEVCFAEEEGLVFPKRPSSRMKRFLRRASEVTGIRVGTTKIAWRDSAASVAMKRGLQAMTLVGMDGSKPALLGQGDDVMENVDEQMVAENAQFVLEIIKNI